MVVYLPHFRIITSNVNLPISLWHIFSRCFRRGGLTTKEIWLECLIRFMFPSSSGLHRSRRFEPIRRLKRDGTRTTRPFRDFPTTFNLFSLTYKRNEGRRTRSHDFLNFPLSLVVMVPFPYVFFLSESVKMCLISLLLKHAAFESTSRKKKKLLRAGYVWGETCQKFARGNSILHGPRYLPLFPNDFLSILSSLEMSLSLCIFQSYRNSYSTQDDVLLLRDEMHFLNAM